MPRLYGLFNTNLGDMITVLANTSLGHQDEIKKIHDKLQFDLQNNSNCTDWHDKFWCDVGPVRDAILNKDHSVYTENKVAWFASMGVDQIWAHMDDEEKDGFASTVMELTRNGALLAACGSHLGVFEDVAKDFINQNPKAGAKDFHNIVLRDMMSGKMGDKLNDVVNEKTMSRIMEHLPAIFKAPGGGPDGKNSNVFADIMQLSSQLSDLEAGGKGPADHDSASVKANMPTPKSAEEAVDNLKQLLQSAMPNMNLNDDHFNMDTMTQMLSQIPTQMPAKNLKQS